MYLCVCIGSCAPLCAHMRASRPFALPLRARTCRTITATTRKRTTDGDTLLQAMRNKIADILSEADARDAMRKGPGKGGARF